MSTFRFRFIWHLNIDSNATGWMVCSLLLWMWFCVDVFLCFVLSFGSIARFGRRRRFTFVRMSCPRMKLDAQMDMEMGKPIEMCTTNERRTYRTIWTHTQTHTNCKWNGTHKSNNRHKYFFRQTKQCTGKKRRPRNMSQMGKQTSSLKW